jgi:hypothetical protein
MPRPETAMTAVPTLNSAPRTQWRPLLVLLLLAPLIPEGLSGSTPIQRFLNPFVLLLLVGLYGCGAVLVREIVRRRGLRWPAVLVLGAAYGIIEEGLQIQSFFNDHHADLGTLATFGKAAGVHWIWAENLTIFHAAVSIAVPIALTELAFPARRTLPWLSRRAFVIVAALFGLDVLAGFVLFSAMFEKAFGYRVPIPQWGGFAALTLVLISAVLLWPVRPARAVPPKRRNAWPPFAIGLVSALGLIGLFVVGNGLVDGARQRIAPPIVALAVALWAALIYVLLRRLLGPGREYNDRHRFAAAAAPVVVIALFALLLARQVHATDTGGGAKYMGFQWIAGLAALVSLWWMGRRIKRRIRPPRPLAPSRLEPQPALGSVPLA